MTPTIVLDLIVSVLAIGLLATVMRLAYLTAGGHFEHAAAPAVPEPGDDELGRAA